MKRNMFGEPQPASLDEMFAVLDEMGSDTADMNADVEFGDDEGPFKGWAAEVRHNSSGETVFSTVGYEDRAQLIKDLKAIGITDINFL